MSPAASFSLARDWRLCVATLPLSPLLPVFYAFQTYHYLKVYGVTEGGFHAAQMVFMVWNALVSPKTRRWRRSPRTCGTSRPRTSAAPSAAKTLRSWPRSPSLSNPTLLTDTSILSQERSFFRVAIAEAGQSSRTPHCRRAVRRTRAQRVGRATVVPLDIPH